MNLILVLLFNAFHSYHPDPLTHDLLSNSGNKVLLRNMSSGFYTCWPTCFLVGCLVPILIPVIYSSKCRLYVPRSKPVAQFLPSAITTAGKHLQGACRKLSVFLKCEFPALPNNVHSSGSLCVEGPQTQTWKQTLPFLRAPCLGSFQR